jgi:hypothetical protein
MIFCFPKNLVILGWLDSYQQGGVYMMSTFIKSMHFAPYYWLVTGQKIYPFSVNWIASRG